jgi:lipopolysaccharide export system ATP-binding protein
MIKAKGLVKKYGSREVVKGIDLEMDRGEIVGLLGPNGAGKTTTFYMITGLVRPNKGQVFLDNQEITDTPMYQRSRLGLGYLPQESSIFKKLTVEENIYILWEQIKNVKPEDFDARLTGLLEEMGIAHLRHSKGVELSGGEKRRVEIVRALSTEPAFILLDEPFAGIDPIAVNDIQDIICSLKAKNIGVVITDHSVRETLAICDRAYLIHDGKLILSGDADKIVNDPLAKKFYLGDNFTL